jgi:hypothetical protein
MVFQFNYIFSGIGQQTKKLYDFNKSLFEVFNQITSSVFIKHSKKLNELVGKFIILILFNLATLFKYILCFAI